MEEQKITFYVAGIAHHQIYKCFDEINVSGYLQMVPEPTNKYDPNAIKLLYDDVMIGYVPMKISEEVLTLFKAQKLSCQITEFNKELASYKQIKVVIEEI